MHFLRKTRDVSQEIKTLTTATVSRERGSFVSHDEICQITGLAQTDPEYYRLIKFWKKAMLQAGIEVIAAMPRGTGYKLLTVDEQLKVRPSKLRAQAMRRINRAAACVGSIPAELLDEQGQQLQHAILQQLTDVKAADSTDKAKLASWISNPKTLPKIPQRKVISG